MRKPIALLLALLALGAVSACGSENAGGESDGVLPVERFAERNAGTPQMCKRVLSNYVEWSCTKLNGSYDNGVPVFELESGGYRYGD